MSALAESDFYSTFAKIDDTFFGLLILAGCVVVLLRMRTNGLLTTLVALGGFLCLGLSTLYWLMASFDLITMSNPYVWAASQLIFDFGLLLIVVSFALPRVGGVSAPTGTPRGPETPGRPGGQPGDPAAQPGAYGGYGQPAPHPGRQTPAVPPQQQRSADPQLPPQQ